MCSFEHNGRDFEERDTRSITGIASSSKKGDPDKIGKFGVGFKSVFIYTDSPKVYSKTYSFKILQRILPQEIPSKPGLKENTRFELPFNSQKKSAIEAYAEIKTGLEQLSERTLLFLSSLKCIRWKIGEVVCEIFREEHSTIHIEISKVIDGVNVQRSHWLRFSEPVKNVRQFTAPVDGLEGQKVAVAFKLAFQSGIESFIKSKSIAEQFYIVPAAPGKVSVFFPAEKEASGLRFHLHAPFIPELSRASIKNSPENLPLFDQLAKVTAQSLHEIKALGLLVREFLSVLPNHDDYLPSHQYVMIRKAVLDEMKSQALVPTQRGGHAPAVRLFQGRAPIKELLSDGDLAFFSGRDDAPTWVVGATQRNSQQDRFLGSLDMPTWDVEDLRKLFETRAHSRYVDPAIIKWLASKPPEWHQMLYALLDDHCEREYKQGYRSLSETQIVRMANGNYSLPQRAYFHTGLQSIVDAFPRIDEAVLTVGTKTDRQANARKFLEKIGVKVPGERDEVEHLLRTRYDTVENLPTEEIYIADLQRLIDFTNKYPNEGQLFTSAFIFRVDAPEIGKRVWSKVGFVYLGDPFLSTGLHYFYDCYDASDKGAIQRWPLSRWYSNCGIPVDRIVRFAQFCGCEDKFYGLSERVLCYDNPNWLYLSAAPGKIFRSDSGFDTDYAIVPQTLRMLQSNQIDASRLVWLAMCEAGTSVLCATYQRNQKGGSRYADSQLVCVLKELEWVPLSDGRFVKPCDASPKLLLKGFPIDTRFEWLEKVAFGTAEKKQAAETHQHAQKRLDLGFDSEEDYQDGLKFAQLPVEKRKKLLSQWKHQENTGVTLPERPVHNPEFRAQRVSEQAQQAPDRTSIIKERAVPLGAEVAKAEARIYLIDQYTNTDGQMICQVCKDELPFKLPVGDYYFEAIEIIYDSPKRYREGYLALCPNHAAMFQYANPKRDTMRTVVLSAIGNEIDVILGGVQKALYFTAMHLADAKACMASNRDEEEN